MVWAKAQNKPGWQTAPWRRLAQKDVREKINVLKLLVGGSVFKSAMKEDQLNRELSLLLPTVPVKEQSVEAPKYCTKLEFVLPKICPTQLPSG